MTNMIQRQEDVRAVTAASMIARKEEFHSENREYIFLREMRDVAIYKIEELVTLSFKKRLCEIAVAFSNDGKPFITNDQLNVLLDNL